MSKEEILNEEFAEKEIIKPKSHKKIKIVFAITSSLILVAVTTLLVGHFQFNWFKSEIYDIDAKITRNLYQANYFTEVKDLKTKIVFSNGISEDHDMKIYTNFMAIITDIKDFLNTAILVILDTKVKTKNEMKDAISFNIFDEEKIKEVMTNPDGSKYPLALFKFYENGTLYDIQLPKNMNEYHSKTIIQLIESIIPKLSRNRTEDISNGLAIKTKKDKKKKTLVESYSPREIPDFRDSKFVKSVERDIENEKLTGVRTKTNILLETKLKEDEIPFIFQELNFEQKSEIITTSSKEEKEKLELIQELASHFTFVKSEDLLKSFSKEENTEKKNVKDALGEEASKIRKLMFNYTGENISTIKFYNTLGKRLEIYVDIGCNLYDAYGYIYIWTSDSIGNYLGKKFVEGKRMWAGEVKLLDFEFPNITGIHIYYKVKGRINVEIGYNSNSNLRIDLDANLYSDASIYDGFDQFAYITAGAKGTFLSGSATGLFNNYGEVNITKGHFSGGMTLVYVEGKDFGYEKFYHEFELYQGWEKDL